MGIELRDKKKIDQVGRIVIPITVRRMLNLEEKDTLIVEVEDEVIHLKKELRG